MHTYECKSIELYTIKQDCVWGRCGGGPRTVGSAQPCAREGRLSALLKNKN